MKLFERIKMLTSPDELDRHAGDLLDRERRPTACIAIQLRQDDAIQLELLVEDLRAVDGILPRHAVDNEINLLRPNLPIDPLELSHQLIINVQPPGRIENDNIRIVL